MVRGWSSYADKGRPGGRALGLLTVGRCRMWFSEDVAWVLSWLISTATWRMQRPHSCSLPLVWKPPTFGKSRSRLLSLAAGRCPEPGCWNFSGGCWCRSGYLLTQPRQPHTTAWGDACRLWQTVCWCRRMNCRRLVTGRSCRRAAMVTLPSRNPGEHPYGPPLCRREAGTVGLPLRGSV